MVATKQNLSRSLDKHETDSFDPKRKVVYSICMTGYNTRRSAQASLDSILTQIDDRFEIIVVDNVSTDGSLEILKEYQRQNKITLISTPCSRGLGREIAVRCAKGKYILIMDMDDVFEPKLAKMLEVYHKSFEGLMLLVSGIPGVVVSPKALIEKIGGYRDLNWLEDSDIYARAAEINCFGFFDSIKMISYSIKDQRFIFHVSRYAKNNYMFFRAAFRLGCGPSRVKYIIRLRLSRKDHPLFLPVDMLLAIWGGITHLAYPCYPSKYYKNFSVYNFPAQEVKPSESN
jgi:glycosyltransferase involved in cell wall biosynthesis